jgi:tetratricopeptide (TPR) repeat protein
MALSKLHDSGPTDRALKLLEYIVNFCSEDNSAATAALCDPDIPDADGFQYLRLRLTKVDRRQFACVAESARTAVRAAQAEYHCVSDAEVFQVLGKITEVENQIHNAAHNLDAANGSGSQDSRSLNLALATVLCAKGKVQSILAEETPARESLNRAILLAPNLVDAQLSLALSYLNQYAKEEGSSWIRLTENALQKALTFDPNCPKAYYLLARLAYQRPRPDFNQALKDLEKTENLPEACFLRAEIYANPAFGGHDIEAAIEAWHEGLDGLPRLISLEQACHLQKLQLAAECYPNHDKLQRIAAQALKHVDQNCPWQSRKRTFCTPSGDASRVSDSQAAAAAATT